MRIICIVNGGCRWNLLREEWLRPDADHATVRLLRFEECQYCRDTRATLTSPEMEETRLSKPRALYPKEVEA
jgi:hypothetical protein